MNRNTKFWRKYVWLNADLHVMDRVLDLEKLKLLIIPVPRKHNFAKKLLNMNLALEVANYRFF